jgi:hypothetical protein
LDITPDVLPNTMSHKDLAAPGRDAGIEILIAPSISIRELTTTGCARGGIAIGEE